MEINEEGTYINKTLDRNNGVLKALLFNYPPYVFKDEKGELVGSFDQFLYDFPRIFGSQVDIEETSSIDELKQAIQNEEFDIVNYFIQDNFPTENSYILFDEGRLNPVIRYLNHPYSTKWNLYESIVQFDGEKLGCLNSSFFEYLYKEKFPKSEVKYYNKDYDLLYNLLRDEIKGFLTDENSAKNFKKKFPDKITNFYNNDTNNLGFGFKKNDNTLLNEFNEFLENIDREKLFEKWNVEDTFNISNRKR